MWIANRNVQSVLFACTFNAVRSPMAEGLARLRCRNRLFIASCGVRVGELDPFAVEVMDEIGIDISKHRPRSFDDLDDGAFDLVVSLSPVAQHRAVEMTRTDSVEIMYWPTHDPTAIEGARSQRLDAYREVRNQLDARIRSVFSEWSTY